MPASIGVVPLDGSATAEVVLPWAIVMAKALRLRLVLLQLVPDAWPGGDAPAEAALRPARHYLDGVAASLGDAADGIDIETQAQPVGDDLAAGIIGAAGSLDADVIVLATHGRSGVKRWVLGSVAETVVRTAASPVMVIRANAEAPTPETPAIRRILLALDGSPTAESALPQAMRLARACNATLDLLQVAPWAWSAVAGSTEVVMIPEGVEEAVAESAEAYLQGVQARLSTEVRTEHHVRRGDPTSGILDHLVATGADIVVMSTHGRTGLTRWVLGSVAQRVLHTSERPVLLIRATAPDTLVTDHVRQAIVLPV